MSEFRADLHCHSNCSDGSDSPEKLLELARQAGLSGLSITDHDTIQAYTPELDAKARSLQLELLMGAEISTEQEGLTVHILAYGFDRTLESFLKEVGARRAKRNEQILANLNKRGILIHAGDLPLQTSGRIIGRPHIAAAIVKRGGASSIQDAFERYLKDAACCYARGGKFSPLDAIKAIHQARGKAILAHPHFLKKGRFLRSLLALPFDGLECYYGRLAKEQEKPWVQFALEKGWIATGGSDYHGASRPFVSLGSSWVGEATFRQLAG